MELEYSHNQCGVKPVTKGACIITASLLSRIFIDNFALSQSCAWILVAFNSHTRAATGWLSRADHGSMWRWRGYGSRRFRSYDTRAPSKPKNNNNIRTQNPLRTRARNVTKSKPFYVQPYLPVRTVVKFVNTIISTNSAALIYRTIKKKQHFTQNTRISPKSDMKRAT